MLFYLKKKGGDDVYLYLPGKKKYTVGRKNCDIILKEDQSISRKHAILDTENDDYVKLQDCEARFNTFYNGTKLSPNQTVRLTDGSTIHFGILTSIYSCHEVQLITATSKLGSAIKSHMLDQINYLNGKIVDNWTSDCTHLTVTEITLTVKVLNALIDEKPIVTPIYWKVFEKNVQKNLPPPNVDDFRPALAEPLLNQASLLVNTSRKLLFKKKIFVFSNERKFKQMEEIIRKAGGECLLWKEKKLTTKDFSSPKAFVIIHDDFNDYPDLKRLVDSFKSKGQRTIPLQEIAMAVVSCSCEKDCNPNYSRAREVFRAPQIEESEVQLAPDTPASDYFTPLECDAKDLLVIPETRDFSLNELLPSTSTSIPVQSSSLGSKAVQMNFYSKATASAGSVLEKTKAAQSENYGKRSQESDIQNPFKRMKMSFERKNLERQAVQRVDSSASQNNIQSSRTTNKQSATTSCTSSTSKQNPFIFLREKSKALETSNILSQDNPIKTCSQKRKVADDNIKSQPKRSKQDSIVASTFNEKIQKVPRIMADISNINYEKDSGENSTWMSKRSNKDLIQVKKEVDEEILETKNLDIEKFINSFKAVNVKIELIPVNYNKKIYNDEVDASSVSHGKNNFKKFRKINPLRPQSRIISEDNLIAN